MQCLDPGQVVLEQRGQGGGKGGEPVFVALAGADSELLHLKIDVLDPEPDRFHDAQPAAVEELGDHLAVPSMNEITAATSSRVMTTGTLIFLSARTALMLSCRGWLRTRL